MALRRTTLSTGTRSGLRVRRTVNPDDFGTRAASPSDGFGTRLASFSDGYGTVSDTSGARFGTLSAADPEAAAFGTIQARTLESRTDTSNCTPGALAPTAGSDATFPHPRTGRPVSIRGLLGTFRAAGLPVHPLGDDNDDAFFERVASRLASLAATPTSALAGDVRGRPDDADLRCDWMGIDRARSPFGGPAADPFFHGAAFPTAQQGDGVSQDEARADDGLNYGYYEDVLDDIASLRGSLFRESVSTDLTWHYLHLDAEIPEPSDLIADLDANRYARMHRFWWLVLVAIVTRTRLVPTIFVRGGGEGLNPDTHAESDTLADPVTGSAADGAPTYRALVNGAPGHQRSVIVPSAFGWASWYHDDADIPASVSGDPSHEFERFCLHLYADDTSDPGRPARKTTFQGLVTLRKSLGLAAFGDVIGRGLNTLQRALELNGLHLGDHIPHLELGAEMDAEWAFTLGLDLSDPSSTDNPRISAREYARFHAILAASILAHWPHARFKCSELASAATAEQEVARFAWMGNALSEQLYAEVAFLNRIVLLKREAASGVDIAATYGGDADSDRALDWIDEAAVAGVEFPTTARTYSLSNLVQLVGFHWFHYSMPEYDGRGYASGYQSETVCLQYTVDPLRTFLLGPCRDYGLTLQWAVGNLGFPSDITYGDSQGGDLLPLYGANSQEMQACHLVRSMLTFLGYGATHVLWYAHMEARELVNERSSVAGLFTSMGLRNDVAAVTFPPASEDAWQKASWWAYQRLATLLAHASAVEVLHNVGGAVLVRISGGSVGLAAPDSTRTWRYAYVFWVDGGDSTSVASAEVTLTVAGTGEYELLPLVPAATLPGAFAVEPQRYADSSDPDWAAGEAATPHSSTVTATSFEVGPFRFPADEIRIAVTQSLPATYGLVAWLTDSARASMR